MRVAQHWPELEANPQRVADLSFREGVRLLESTPPTETDAAATSAGEPEPDDDSEDVARDRLVFLCCVHERRLHYLGFEITDPLLREQMGAANDQEFLDLLDLAIEEKCARPPGEEHNDWLETQVAWFAVEKGLGIFGR